MLFNIVFLLFSSNIFCMQDNISRASNDGVGRVFSQYFGKDSLSKKMKMDIEFYRTLSSKEFATLINSKPFLIFLFCNKKKMMFSDHEIIEIITSHLIDEKSYYSMKNQNISLDKFNYPASSLKYYFANGINDDSLKYEDKYYFECLHICSYASLHDDKLKKSLELINKASYMPSKNININLSQNLFILIPNATVIYSAFSEMQRIEGGIYHNKLKKLIVTKSEITRILKGTLNLPNLEHLCFACNQIDHIDREAFAGMPKLKELNLDGNQITRFGSNQLIGINIDECKIKLNNNPLNSESANYYNYLKSKK
ncbi:leucine-rich repeat domain-containing protein [Candidatus Cytomitobacter indipagum]|nr:leucine-rich repeat domain-containing protein [Candidatus Cytomitobacter indipagum]